ncbi:MAG: hypothetical protein [Caudoviricetes sp.]|nr:MAG: hypothetical protein [Caudoviricetes sp.]
MALVELIKVKISELFATAPVAGAVERSVYDRLYEDAIWVTDYGAKGDWNSDTQTGTDSTAAVQSALNNLGATYRKGGLRRLYFPAGNYKLSSVTVPASLEFGLMICGAGKYGSIVWSDHTDLNPTFNSEIDFVHFQSIGLFGALSQTSNSALWKGCIYRGRKANFAPDVDVTFTDCVIGHAVDGIQAYGRGVVVDPSCVCFYLTYLLNIVADPSIVFPGGDTNSVGTGMRNYHISPARCDVVSRLVRVTGTGACKDHINDILINGVDALSMDRIIDFADATITGLSISDCTMRNSFSGPAVFGKRLLDSSIEINTAKQYDRNVASTNRMLGVLQLSASAERVRIRGNYRELSSNVVQIGALSSDVNIDIDVFSLAQNGLAFTAVTGASVNGLNIRISTSGVAPVGQCRFFAEGTQASPTFQCWSSYNGFYRPATVFTPVLYVGAAAQTASSARGEVQLVNGESFQRLYWVGTGLSVASAEVSLTLSGTPLTDYLDSSSLVGRVSIGNTSYTQLLTARVDTSTGRIVFYKAGGTRLLGSDLPTNFSISVELRVRTQQSI